MNRPLPDPLLEAAVTHLSRRNFPRCRSYALRSRASSPLNSDADRILAVADTLSASQTRISETLIDWYAILQIYRYSQDTNLITKQFKRLSLLLYPEQNKFPFAQEAFKLVCEAGSVLSNSVKKSQFDNELQAIELRKDETFWTVCPYCYFMYEYVRVYEDCCLRCQNEKCGRGFSAVAVKSPPLEVVEKGEFKCMGFVPLGFDEGLKNGDSNWNPFSPLVKVKKSDGDKNDVPGVGNEGNGEGFIEISDESSGSDNGDERRNGGSHGNDNDDEVGRSGELQQNHGFGNPVMKRRKKSVPRNAKKLMGKGPRARRMETFAQGSEGLDLNTRAGEDNNGGNGNSSRPPVGGEEMGSEADFGTPGVDLLAGDDDIFVTFPDCF